MVGRAVLQTCVAFCCGVMFGLYLYAYSSQESQFSSVFKTPLHHRIFSSSNYDNIQYNKTQSNTRRRPLENGKPSEFSSYSTTIQATKVVTSYPTFVLILAYMRSGSTLTGDVIQQNNNTLYSFEPLFSIWQSNGSTFASGEKKFFSTISEKTDESLRQLKAWYTCNLMGVTLETHKNVFMDFGLKTRATRSCMRKYYKNHFNEKVKENCITPLIHRCENSSVRVVKTIRLYARDIESLMQDFPTLKVIHLVRDPRGILVSRKRVDHFHTSGVPMSDLSNHLCPRIMDDYNTIQRFIKTYPNRIMRLRYEELATYPLDTVKRIYKFIGMEATEKVLKAVTHMTSSKSNVEQNFNTARKNSVYTANAWRDKMPLNVTRIIDSVCADVYDKYGYKKAKSRHHLKNIKGERLWVEKINS